MEPKPDPQSSDSVPPIPPPPIVTPKSRVPTHMQSAAVPPRAQETREPVYTQPKNAERRYLNPGELSRLRNFQFAAKLVVEGLFQGKHRSPYYDFSSEFADYRPYSPGDEIRAIDWRAYARTDRYYIKLFRKETDMSCTIVVDKSRSMGFRGEAGEVSKLEYASYLAAALSYLLVRQGDKAGLALCDTKIEHYVPPGSTNQTLQRTIHALETVKSGGPTQLAGALQALFGIVKRRGLLVVVSDFLDDTDAIFSALGMFAHKGFQVLLFHTLTPDELMLPDVANALFIEPESMFKIAAEPDSIRDAYQAEIAAFVRDLDTRAKARRMHYHLCSTATPYHFALEAYLTSRGRH